MAKRPQAFCPPGKQSRVQQSRDYDRRRGTSRERGYNAPWDNASRGFRKRNPLCLGCEAAGILACTEVVDHVEPHRGDTLKFWNKAMWQPACRWHHSVVKQQLERMWDQSRITTADLWLNSPVALRIAEGLRPPA